MYRTLIAAALLLIACGGTNKTVDMPPAENELEAEAPDDSKPADAIESTAKLQPDPDGDWREFKKLVDPETGEEIWQGPENAQIEVQQEELSDEDAHKAFLKAFYARLAEQDYELKQERLEQHESRPAYFRTYLFTLEGVDFEAFIWNYMDRGNAVTISGKFKLGSEGLKTFREFLKSKKNKDDQ